MKKFFLFGLLVFLLTINIAGCGYNTQQTPSNHDQTLTIGVMPDVVSIPFIIAKHQGYFEEEGLDVKIEYFKSAMDRDAALQTKNIDGAISDMLSLIFFQDNGFDVKITSRTDGSFKLIAGKDSNLSSTKSFNGKTIGISKNTVIDYLTDRFMENLSGDKPSIEKIAIPQIPTRLEMLSNGKLDMAILPEPLASVAIGGGGTVLSDSETLNINPGIVLFRQDTIDSKPMEITDLYKAYNKAVDYLNQEQLSSYIQVLVDEGGFPPSIGDTLTLPHYEKASLPEEKELNQVLNWLHDRGLSKSTFTLDELSDPSFIQP